MKLFGLINKYKKYIVKEKIQTVIYMEITAKMLIYFIITKVGRKVTEIEKGCTSKPVKN